MCIALTKVTTNLTTTLNIIAEHIEMETFISPSLLSANFLDLKSDIEMINNSEADWLHLDIMDGVFVPNISFGFPVINALAKE